MINKRDSRLDTMRGILLAMMTLNHLGGQLRDFTTEPFGFVTAAEGFILLSAYTYAITSRVAQAPFASLAHTAGKRALKIYKYHMLAFALLLVVALAVPAYGDIFGPRFFGQSGSTTMAAVGAALLVHQPKFFDILPMYIVFALLSPVVLYGLRQGQGALVLLGSVALWMAGHVFDPTKAAADALAIGASKGYFNLLSWQLLWVLGLYAGYAHKHAERRDLPRNSLLLAACVMIVVACLMSKHGMIDVADHLLPYFDKATLGVMRLVNVIAQLTVLCALLRLVNRDSSLPWFSFIGRYSLQVFTYHVVVVYLAVPVGWRMKTAFGPAGDVILSLVLVASLTLPALLFRALEKRGAAPTRQPTPA